MTLLVCLKWKPFHAKNVIIFFLCLLPVDITAAVAPDKLIPSLSICVVPMSPSGEEWGEGDAGVSCSGKLFFCLEKNPKVKMFFKEYVKSFCYQLPSYWMCVIPYYKSTSQNRKDKVQERKTQKLSVCIYSYLSKAVEAKWLKKEPTSIRKVGKEWALETNSWRF